MGIVFKFAWILFIVITLINVIILKKQLQVYIDEKPEREKGYNLIIKNFLIFGLTPWIIMGLGNLSGLTSSVFDYFRPAEMKPVVLIFHASIIVIWLALIRFVFFTNGAAFLADHPGIIRFNAFGKVIDNPSESAIKLFVILAVLGGIFGMIMMWIVEIPPIK